MAKAPLIRTALHALIPSLRVPIVSAPMAGAAGGKLAGAVSKAGGLGFIGAGYLSPSLLKAELEHARTSLGQAERLEIGIGFLVWRLASLDRSTSESVQEIVKNSPKAIECIDLVLGYRPRAIWLAFSNSLEEMKVWTLIFKQRQKELFGEKESWVFFVGCGNEEEARFAVEEIEADVIVAQGIESGGHGLATSPPLPTFLTTLRTKLPTWKRQPPFLGAGGLSSGSDLASVLAQGGAGAVYGTRFLLTPECVYSDVRKQVLVNAEGSETKRSYAYDQARGTTEWPPAVDGRGVMNETVKEFEEGELSMDERQERYSKAEKDGDKDRLIVWAGTGVGNMKEILPAAQVVEELEEEAVSALLRAADCLV